MKKLIVLLFCFLFFVFGCDQKSTESLKEKSNNYLKMENMLNEDIELLAFKYNIDTKKLLDIVADYEELTTGTSLTKLINNASRNIKEDAVVPRQ